MPIYEKKWWKKLFKPPKKKKKIDVVADIEAIREFLAEVKDDAKLLIPEFEKLEELEKERMIGSKTILQINLETQEKIYEKILNQYSSFQDDVDINGLRLKKLAEQFLKNAEHAGLSDLVKEKKKDLKWRFQW